MIAMVFGLLADAIVVAHFAYMAYVVIGQIAIVAGMAARRP